MSQHNQVPCASSFASASKTVAETTLGEKAAKDSCKTEMERSLSAQMYQSKDSGFFSTALISQKIGKTTTKKRLQPENTTEVNKGLSANRDSLFSHQSRLLVSYNVKTIITTIAEQRRREQTLEERLRITLDSVRHLMKIDQNNQKEIHKYLFARAVKYFSQNDQLIPSFEDLGQIGKRSETEQEIQEKFRIDKLLIDHYLTSQGSKQVKGTEKAVSVDPVGPKQRSGNILLKWSQTEEEVNEKASFCTTLFGSERFDEKLLSLAWKQPKTFFQDK